MILLKSDLWKIKENKEKQFPPQNQKGKICKSKLIKVVKFYFFYKYKGSVSIHPSFKKISKNPIKRALGFMQAFFSLQFCRKID